MDHFSEARFHDDTAAREYLERLLWPSGPVCPHCGVIGHAYKTKRAGVFRCAEPKCRKDFSVTMKTVMERSKIPLHKWMQAFHLMVSSKTGVSAHQLHRMLNMTYEAAWFMAHRIREAMRAGGLAPMGGSGEIVEVDETVIGRRQGIGRKSVRKARAGFAHKNVVLTLVQRVGGSRSFHVDGVRADDIVPVIKKNIARESTMMTDEATVYGEIGREFARHESVTHSADEYVRGDVTTNTVEGFFSIFKRGMKGVYQHCGEKHLHRYLACTRFG